MAGRRSDTTGAIPHRPTPTFNDTYRLPVHVHETAVGADFDTPEPALHAIVAGELPVYAYFRRGAGPLLNIVFHSAVDRARKPVPFFERMRASRDMPGSVLLVSDPTLFVADDLQFGWYVGTAGWDPTPTIRGLVHRASEAAGASRLLFIGSSAGGFAALRHSSAFPESLTLAINPHVDLLRYYDRWLQHLFGAAFPGVDRTEAGRLLRHRFSVLGDYQRGTWTNRVLYVQNSQDTNPRTNHLPAFLDATGMSGPGQSEDGRITVVQDDHGAGRKGPDAAAFERLYAQSRRILGVEG